MGTNFQQNMTILSIPLEKNPLKRRIGGVITAATAFHNLKQSKNKDTIGTKESKY